MGDDEIITLLRSLPRLTFLAADGDFYKPVLRHASCCLVYVETALGDFS